MATLYVMLGLPGSGKSYTALQLARRENAEIYSSDSFRLQMHLNAENAKQNNDLFDLMYQKIREELDEGNDIVLDATNTYSIYRKKIFNALNGSGAKIVCVFVLRKYENCLKANRKRKGTARISPDIITQFYKEFDVPLSDEPFDEVILHYIDHDRNSLGTLSGSTEENIEAIFENGKNQDLLSEEERESFRNICSYNSLFYDYGKDDSYKLKIANQIRQKPVN